MEKEGIKIIDWFCNVEVLDFVILYIFGIY